MPRSELRWSANGERGGAKWWQGQAAVQELTGLSMASLHSSSCCKLCRSPATWLVQLPFQATRRDATKRTGARCELHSAHQAPCCPPSHPPVPQASGLVQHKTVQLGRLTACRTLLLLRPLSASALITCRLRRLLHLLLLLRAIHHTLHLLSLLHLLIS